MITPEARERWRKQATQIANHHGTGCFWPMPCECNEARILALLDALNEAERLSDEAFDHALVSDVRCVDAESRARDLEAENARLRALLAEDVALLEELDAAWGGAGGAGS